MSAVGRNYAEVLLELAKANGAVEQYADLIDAVASAVETTPEVEATLMSPRVPKAKKVALLEAALTSTPRPFSLFVQSVVRRGRQGSLRGIASEYLALVDLQLGRVRASVTLARAVDAEAQAALVAQLSKAIGKDVIAAFATDPALLGGTIIKIGDRVYDGSVRKRLGRLRTQLLAR